jgi:opacity protein-like surface antigen
MHLTDPTPGIIFGCINGNSLCSGDTYAAKIWGGGSPVVAGRFGYQFTPLFRGDISVTALAFTAAGKIFETDRGCAVGDCGLNNTKSALSVVTLFNGYIDGPQFGHWRPYVTGGIGWARNSVGANGISCDYSAENEDHTTHEFAWAVGAGTRVNVFRDFSVDLAYRYYHLGTFQSGLNGTGSKNPTDVNGGDTFKAGAHTLTLGLAYQFSSIPWPF